jgi:hypothetical protein
VEQNYLVILFLNKVAKLAVGEFSCYLPRCKIQFDVDWAMLEVNL